MRKTQFRKINSLLNTLEEAHHEIGARLNSVNLELLQQCQECAIVMGNSIESSEGKGNECVVLLEEYCEDLYQLSQFGSHKEMKLVTEKIKNNLKLFRRKLHQIEIKTEIVFLPYKAAMWDSLESIWHIASKTKNCECYVIPIPYFEKNQDGTLGEMHDESNEYPKRVPIISWKEYNIEKRNPDVIFIHNPYDNYNLVTSVHPQFYAERICQFTDKLVYVPYFVLPETVVKDTNKIKNIKHFCCLPGTIFADKVILQSQDIRQVYINEYIRFVEESGNTIERNELEKKFLALGSPKFDRLESEFKKDIEIPKEWNNIIIKKDGSRKKIILYNTTIGSLLHHEEKMIKKMKEVFTIFWENRDETALLWRPHPLIESTISAMRPQLWVIYQKLLNEYKGDAWGIYDDTPDIHRAINISDAYYGDRSSVAVMYEKTGKPILIQDVNWI